MLSSSATLPVKGGFHQPKGLGNTSIMDYLNIGVHEFGHAAGLAHPDSSCTEESMYAFATKGETRKRTLNTGDNTGIQKAY